ncbi:failed axon connections homolog isoform X2 [Mercenaria mercenaria]|uniref:failed axon connections homolog isoform X2 n=1 Tax=Mercenaria mercenaria TaxID=6596 RepID=UPI00234F5778|nr:failed axon connections homolog isoform X2 [Mercenaria mercenaria]
MRTYFAAQVSSVMETFLGRNVVYTAAGLSAVVGTSIYLLKRLKSMDVVQKERVCVIDYPENVVIVHTFGRGKKGPDISHFVVKLETYLRVNKIPYQCDFTANNHLLGPKKKSPWIEYNGTTMGDSQLIIEFLNKEFKVDMNSDLTKQEKALAWAIQKWIEELNVHTRWVLLCDEMYQEGFSPFPMEQKSFLNKRFSGMTYAVGIGRHSKSEVQDMIVDNLRHFSDILGDNEYIMGDKMTVVDCAAFGILSQMRWQTPSACPGTNLFQGGEISNVNHYLDRIRDQYWPDFDSPIH